MSSSFNLYRFGSFELNEATEVLARDGKPIKLTETEYKLLLYLLKNRGKAVSKNDIFEEVWGMDSETKEGSIYTFISGLRTKLGQTKEKVFIFTEPNGKGYKFIEPLKVLKYSKPDAESEESCRSNDAIKENNNFSKKTVTDELPTTLNIDQVNFGLYSIVAISSAAMGLIYILIGIGFGKFYDQNFEKTLFIIISFCSYGILFAVCLLLEVAYQFDEYRGKIERVCLSFLLFQGGTIFAALTVANNLLPESLLKAGGTGILILISGVILTCILARFILPDTSITAAKPQIQTQPAFWAFCKNAVFYNLPIYMIFCFVLFCLLYGNSVISKKLYVPIGFAVLLLGIIAFSYISTMVMLDNLLTKKEGDQYKYYGLFVSLLFLRAGMWFIPTFLLVLWYFLKVIDSKN